MLADLKLQESSGHFQNFVRISSQDFEFLLNAISPKIKKMDTTMRKAITVIERLAITLRFLATGESYTSLQYLFKVSKQRISVIVPEVCRALIEVLKENIKVRILTDIYLFIQVLYTLQYPSMARIDEE